METPGFSPLSSCQKAPPLNQYAIYMLAHAPTARVYVGSTTLLRDKLVWWLYALTRPNAKGLPAKVTDLLAAHGHDAGAWHYKVLDWNKPERLNPKARGADRPEWPIVAKLASADPAMVLNTLDNATHSNGKLVPAPKPSRKGIAPITHLGRRLGHLPGPKFEKRPEHSWKVQAFPKPVRSPATGVSFAAYLYRGCKQAKLWNPHPNNVNEMYHHWASHVPASWQCNLPKDVFGTDQALAVPLPPGYAIDF